MEHETCVVWSMGIATFAAALMLISANTTIESRDLSSRTRATTRTGFFRDACMRIPAAGIPEIDGMD